MCSSDLAFYECRSLESVTIPGAVKVIGIGAFDNCMSLSNVVLAEGLEQITTDAFGGCESLQRIDLPASLVSIGEYAFADCINLQEINIQAPSELTTIEEYALADTALVNVTLPASLVTLGECVFYRDFDLTQVVYEGDAPAATEIYDQTPEDVTSYYYAGTSGWPAANIWQERALQKLVTVTVIGGSVSGVSSSPVQGTFLPGDEVMIEAMIPEGSLFVEWNVVEGDVVLDDPLATVSTFVVPTNNVIVEAVTRVIQEPTIDPIQAIFDKNEVNPLPVLVIKNDGDYSFGGLENDGVPMQEGDDYTLNNEEVLINTTYLNTLQPGSYIITFLYEGAGTNPELRLTVVEAEWPIVLEVIPDGVTVPSTGVIRITFNRVM